MPTPYLTFDGTAADALAFYARVLGGEVLFSQTFGDSPMAADIPEAFRGRLMHATLRLPTGNVMASDTGPWAPYEGAMRSCSLSLNFANAEEAKAAFDALSDGGTVEMPFAATFWTPGFGMLRDRYGVAWMVNVDHGEPQ